MAKVGKKYKEALALVDKEKSYSYLEATTVIKQISKAKFDETVDVSIKVNLKKGQSVRDTLVLPHQTASEKKILVFAKGDKATEAEQAGAQFVGDDDYIEKIKNGWLDFDVVIATPEMMKEVGKLGPILGRRGLMPNPKTKTVTMDVAGAIKELQKGRIEIRADKTGIIHVAIGKVSMTAEQLSENMNKVISEIQLKKPADAKGVFLQTVYVSATMSPSVKIAFL